MNASMYRIVKPMNLFRALPPMMTGAIGSVFIARHCIAYAKPHDANTNSKTNNTDANTNSNQVQPYVEPVITLPEYMKKLQGVNIQRKNKINDDKIKELLAWKPFKTFTNPNVIYTMSPDLIDDLDYIRIMYDDRIPSPSIKQSVFCQWERAQSNVKTADEMAFLIHLSHHFRLHEI